MPSNCSLMRMVTVMSKKAKQMHRVLKYIEDFGSVTRLEAMRDLSVANLTAVISSLRKKGVDIKTEIKDGKNRYGEVIHYAVYSFPAKEVSDC